MFSSDEEALEAVKSWWKENGGYIIAGLVIGIALIAGWRFWQASLESEAREASGLYQRVAVAAQAGDREQVMGFTEQLQNDFRRSAYASQASLRVASMAVQNSELDVAGEQLRWVIDNTRDRELEKLARVRLARVLVAGDRPDEALAVLDIPEPGRFGPLFDELRGDAHYAKGDRSAARAAYGRALAADDEQFAASSALDMKYHDLAGYED
ncbi:YfgM family protein [Natronospira bacteriovora]|uniref:Ancillary SecYEG translocon subunit n=1 Tax=Natronospira bacteriovora TaxID=3069753 RepID=A0ABU0W3W5_9GAMM|nr:tetratricopeptide repeat protein [Natronospira sp. AB-CW4]MDQ2068711.1 tetratricopeptide repeat protein [Natronospira sp. AB-CW4]